MHIRSLIRLGTATSIKLWVGGRRDRMILGFTTTYVISAYHY